MKRFTTLVLLLDGYSYWLRKCFESLENPHFRLAYEDWTDRETGEIKQSCTIITNPANELMAKIHNTKARMPAFLVSNFMDWINPEIDIHQRIKLIEPVSSSFLEAVEINEL